SPRTYRRPCPRSARGRHEASDRRGPPRPRCPCAWEFAEALRLRNLDRLKNVEITLVVLRDKSAQPHRGIRALHRVVLAFEVPQKNLLRVKGDPRLPRTALFTPTHPVAIQITGVSTRTRIP